MSKGKLIVLCGLDGAGKSTQINIIKKHFEDQGKTVKPLHFPMYGHSEFSDIITKFLKGEFGKIDEVDPLFIANIYAMDRYMYKDQLLKDLEENDIVLLDRYVLSNIAFQGAKVKDKDEQDKLIKWIRKFEFGFLGLPMADLTIFLDVPIETIEERLNSVREGEDRDYLDGGKDIHEQDIEFQKRVRSIYKKSLIHNYYTFNTYYQGGGILTPNEIFESFKYLL